MHDRSGAEANRAGICGDCTDLGKDLPIEEGGHVRCFSIGSFRAFLPAKCIAVVPMVPGETSKLEDLLRGEQSHHVMVVSFLLASPSQDYRTSCLRTPSLVEDGLPPVSSLDQLHTSAAKVIDSSSLISSRSPLPSSRLPIDSLSTTFLHIPPLLLERSTSSSSPPPAHSHA